MTRSIITSASNKFFPSLINMLGSLHTNFPNHPDVYVYDLGLFYTFRKELESIPWVKVLGIPHFVPFWRACYTWKTYIFTVPPAGLNFYMDAGCQILQPMDKVFETIEKEGYFAVEQVVPGYKIIPPDYVEKFNVDKATLDENSVSGGIFGFKKTGVVSQNIDDMFTAAKQGYCLGFSKGEMWKNKGVNRTEYVRDCEHFRHDTTLITIFLRKNLPGFHLQSALQYAGWVSPHDHPDQVIWNLRMNYKKLDYARSAVIHSSFNVWAICNRIYIKIFIFLKRIRNKIKGI